jgi:GTP cyclohydrolase IV
VSRSRAGVTNVERVIRIGGQLYLATIDGFVEPGSGVPLDLVIDDAAGWKVEELARRIAVDLRERQGAQRAEVRIAVRYPEHKPAPVSGIATQEIYTLLGAAFASERGTRRLVGVSAQGMTASPSAQQLVARHSRERLAAEGFGEEEIESILETVPVATHDQRGLGTLSLELPEDCDADLDAMELLAIVENSMSSEIYELMKRSDEGAVVDKATRRPRYPEDCVSEAIRGVIARFGDLPDDVLVSSRQENLETLHLHTVVAERSGLLGELRRELSAA